MAEASSDKRSLRSSIRPKKLTPMDEALLYIEKDEDRCGLEKVFINDDIG